MQIVYLARGTFVFLLACLAIYLFFLRISPANAYRIEDEGCATDYQALSIAQINHAASIYVERRAETITAPKSEQLIGDVLDLAKSNAHCSPTLAEYNTLITVLTNIGNAIRSFNGSSYPPAINAYVERAYHAQYVLYAQFAWTGLVED